MAGRKPKLYAVRGAPFLIQYSGADEIPAPWQPLIPRITISQAAEASGLPRGTIRSRLEAGIRDWAALTEAPGKATRRRLLVARRVMRLHALAAAGERNAKREKAEAQKRGHKTLGT